MNILFMGLMYHPDEVAEVSSRAKTGLQNQINNYQWAFVDGLRQNLSVGEQVDVLNALPVGIFPTHYRKLALPSKAFGDDFCQIGSLNLPWFKQQQRAVRAEREIERWIAKNDQNRTILLYSLYLPYMKAIARVKRRRPDVKAHVIVTDLPNELGISSGRTGLMKRVEYAMGDRRVAMCQDFDGFVLLTQPMAKALHIEQKPNVVIEGLIRETLSEPSSTSGAEASPKPAVLYTGTLNRELGIGELLAAFQRMPDVELWLCGKGDMESEVRMACQTSSNIRYFGFVSQDKALQLQANADALINPRTSQGAFTRYSFPSKTLEYMRSGKPVLCCKLEGIPDAYDAYLHYIQPQNADGIERAVRAVLALSKEERAAIGSRARRYVLTEKSSAAQGARLLCFLRDND